MVATPTPIPNVALSPALAWETGHPERKVWSQHVLAEFGKYLPAFSKASDRKSYCKNYDSLSDASKTLVWGTMAVEIARYESGFKPASAMTESDGSISQGLYQLTYGNSHCPSKKSQGDLNDPYINMNCAFAIMNDEVKGDGLIASGGYVALGASSPKGLSRYWSVMRDPDRKSKHHKSDIQAVTKALKVCQ